MTEAKIDKTSFRVQLVLYLIVFGFLLCLMRIGWLQLIMGEELTARAEENKNIMRELQSPRGAIYDRQGRELAVSLISLSLYADPLAMDDSGGFAQTSEQRDPRSMAANLLSKELSKSDKELYDLFTSNKHFVWLERTMDKSRTDKIAQILKEHKLNGFGFLKESKRYYPMNSLASQVLGFVGTDDLGLSGIEMTLDSVLKSAVQTQFLETDLAGRPIFSSVMLNNRAQEMSSVYLTIDNRIQYAAEKALAAAMQTTGAKAAAALVMDVHTGEILAMANNPTFDPNHFYNYDPQSWINRSIATIYEPGSTLKPLIAAIAINEGLIQPQTIIHDVGTIKVDDRVIENSERRTYGNIPFSEVITRSINTGMVEVGLSIGKERLNSYARSFGLGDYTDIDLPGEEPGILFKTKDMRPIDMASMSIGQGLAVTPLQLVCSLSSLANDGTPVNPIIIKKILRPDGTDKPLTAKARDTAIISADTCQKVLAMMENVVLRGGGTLAQIPGYRVAGKTGTAEKLKSGGGYAKGEYIASFVGIAPVEQPRFIVLVIVDTPASSYYGSQVAAPVFKEIMQQTLVISGIEPSGTGVLLPKESATSGQQNNNRKSQNISDIYTSIPDLKDFTMRECAKILEQSGLSLLPYGSGTAVRQDPPAFAAGAKESVVSVWFE